MKEAQGNIWEMPCKFRVITTNGQIRQSGRLVMGRGIALQARERYPGIDYMLGKLVADGGNHVYVLPEKGIVSFPTKWDWRRHSNIELIERSARELSYLLRDLLSPGDNVLMPPPGCGNGGLIWKDVKPVIAPLLDDHYVIVHYTGN